MIRCGWVKISKPSLRATAISVMPAASAVRTASAVGADTATMTGMPMAAAFWIISIDSRLVTTPKPPFRVRARARQAPSELVERVVTADVLAQRDEPLLRRTEGRGVHRAGLRD